MHQGTASPQRGWEESEGRQRLESEPSARSLGHTTRREPTYFGVLSQDQRLQDHPAVLGMATGALLSSAGCIRITYT